MPAKIIDGKSIAQSVEAVTCSKNKASFSILSDSFQPATMHPTLAIMSIGNDAASEVYIRNKMQACARNGIGCLTCHYPSDRIELAADMLCRWADDPDVHGIILQLPAPQSEELIDLIPAIKDVDGFKPDSPFTPCTAAGIMRLILDCDSNTSGKNAVVVGRSTIVGRPISKLLLDANCTVTTCHSKTVDLASHTKNADILVVAAGVPRLITADMVKPGAIVIDVGINRVDGKLVGDVDFDAVKEVAGWITPVPGGVGPMTVAMLMANVCQAYRLQNAA